MLFHPREERGTKVETDPRVIIDDGQYPAFAVEKAGRGVWSVTLYRNPLIPVVVGIGGVLKLNFFKPGIFPGGLIKMAMNANILFHFFLPSILIKGQ
jgi:hypothetical protein